MEQLQQFALANRPKVNTLVDLETLRTNSLYYWLNLTLVSFVVAGLREELWRSAVLVGLRQVWPNRFSTKRGQILGVLVAAAIFGLGHLPQGPVAVGLTALLGLGLGVILVMHDSIWPAVVAHGAFDATTFAALPWLMQHLEGT
jgi:membrane protease YdiL (CAAX protease family)